jgi:hypothetical protein
MNNVFSPKRFGKYFCYDLENAWNNFGLSLIVLGLLPAILFVVFQLFSLIFSGHITVSDDAIMPMRFLSGMICVLVGVIVFPTKAYGSITQKRAGSSFLMLPVSTFEKWVSMMLVLCLAAPLCLSALYIGSDTLMGVIFPNAYGTPIVKIPFNDIISEVDLPVDLHIGYAGIALGDWASSSLFFLLGAIIFKKGKVGKTILALFALSIFFSTAMSVAAGAFMDQDANVFLRMFDEDPEIAMRKIINFGKITLYAQVVILMGLSYLRLRSIKH